MNPVLGGGAICDKDSIGAVGSIPKILGVRRYKYILIE